MVGNLSPAAGVISDPDIFRAAKLVIDQRGEEAAMFAAGRADQRLEEGDLDGAFCRGAVFWRRSRSCSGARGGTRR